MALTDKLTSIADAIRGKTGKTDEMTLDQMPAEITSIETGGVADYSTEDWLVARTLTEYTNDRATEIGSYAFYSWVTLTSISLPLVKKIGYESFFGCKGMKEINIPSVLEIKGSAFSGCSEIENLSFPLVVSIDDGAFSGCSKLTDVEIPLITVVNNRVFAYCSALEKINLNVVGAISSQAFYQSINLSTLILRRSTLVGLSNINAFNGTPFASGGTGGTVYCPVALIEQYQTATNWSTLYAAGTCNFVAIEGSEYE